MVQMVLVVHQQLQQVQAVYLRVQDKVVQTVHQVPPLLLQAHQVLLEPPEFQVLMVPQVQTEPPQV